jgi:hypothetical protein
MIRAIVLATLLASASAASATISYVNNVTIAGDATDLSMVSNPPVSGINPAFGGNRLSIGSDLWYDKASRTYWGITDRGPGGGVVEFAPRAHQFSFDTASDGAISNFVLLKTVVFKRPDGTTLFTGLNPQIATGSVSNLGNSLDSEGLVVRPNGNFIVADEYGPSVYEFDKDGKFIRAFETPSNLVPRTGGGAVDYVNTPASGRQDNRGFEGISLSPDGTTLYAVLQDPLRNEGTPDGRRSQNVRIVAYDVMSGEATGQFIYQLQSLAEINANIADPAQHFTNANAQGRNIGLSGIIALDDGKFLVLERDNRGWGVDDANALTTVGLKAVYLVDINGATDVTNMVLTANALPSGVTPVSKTLWLDIRAQLLANGVPVAEKIEGIAFGGYKDGVLSFLAVTDNDFSVTQSGAGVQFNRCSTGIGAGNSFTDVALSDPCPKGTELIPTFAYAFAVTGNSLAGLVPEPATWAMMIAGFGLVGGMLRRRRSMDAHA